MRMEADEAARLVKEVESEEVDRARRDVQRRQERLVSQSTQAQQAPSKLRQGLHAAAAPKPQLMPPTVAPPTRIQQRPTPPASEDGHESPTPTSRSSSSRQRGKRPSPDPEGPSSPFPSIRAEDEGEFFAALAEPQPEIRPSLWAKKFTNTTAIARDVVPPAYQKSRSKTPQPTEEEANVPPQTVLSRVVRELEEDFAHYKS